jgi:excisionase family DNA binding protein
MAEPDMETLMTLRQLIAYLGVSRGTVLRLIHQGDLPAVRVGRALRFQRHAVDDWLARRRVGGCQDAATENGSPARCDSPARCSRGLRGSREGARACRVG